MGLAAASVAAVAPGQANRASRDHSSLVRPLDSRARCTLQSGIGCPRCDQRSRANRPNSRPSAIRLGSMPSGSGIRARPSDRGLRVLHLRRPLRLAAEPVIPGNGNVAARGVGVSCGPNVSCCLGRTASMQVYECHAFSAPAGG